MSKYVALINIPGYLPMDDEPPTFDTPEGAWAYLAEERERGEDAEPTDPAGLEYCEYSDTVAALRHIASGQHKHGDRHEDWPTNPDGTGTVYGATPGRDYVSYKDAAEADSHDLGLAYSVALSEE